MNNNKVEQLKQKIKFLYKDKYVEIFNALLNKLNNHLLKFEPTSHPRWSHADIVLITYPDHVIKKNTKTLESLKQFLFYHKLYDIFSIVHILPFFPYSSDDGFAVINYKEINPAFGSWDDIKNISSRFDLMIDFVLNHVSSQHQWFQMFLAQNPEYLDFFIHFDSPTEHDFSKVLRPRAHPLLTKFETTKGVKFVWTTFSEDQIDLNYQNPKVFLKMIDVFLFYLSLNVRVVRLDAIAYLWKIPNTSCVNLEQTHVFVKILRDIVDIIKPDTILLTETNLPTEQNYSYFGQDDEAHMVYQFALPPLLLDAFWNEDATYINQWLENFYLPKQNNTFLNFTASHDGIGILPIRMILPQKRIDNLVDQTLKRNGKVSYKFDPNAPNNQYPYELNITYFSALSSLDKNTHISKKRFFSSQAFMLALKGIPAVYFNSLFGTENDYKLFEETKHNRSLNRTKFDYDMLNERLNNSNTKEHDIFKTYIKILKQRKTLKALDPQSQQIYVNLQNSFISGFLRVANDNTKVLVLTNFSGKKHTLNLNRCCSKITQNLLDDKFWYDYQSNDNLDVKNFIIHPYQTCWLLVE